MINKRFNPQLVIFCILAIITSCNCSKGNEQCQHNSDCDIAQLNHSVNDITITIRPKKPHYQSYAIVYSDSSIRFNYYDGSDTWAERALSNHITTKVRSLIDTTTHDNVFKDVKLGADSFIVYLKRNPTYGFNMTNLSSMDSIGDIIYKQSPLYVDSRLNPRTNDVIDIFTLNNIMRITNRWHHLELTLNTPQAHYDFEIITLTNNNGQYLYKRVSRDFLKHDVDSLNLNETEQSKLISLISTIDPSVNYYSEQSVEDRHSAKLTIDGHTVFDVYPITFSGIEEYRQIFYFLTDSIMAR